VPPLPGTLGALAEEFVEWTRVSGYAEDTAGMRRRYLAVFAAWCEERGITRPEEVTRPVLLRYQRRLFYHRKRDGKPLSWSTQHVQLVSLRAFFKWLTIESHILFNPASELFLPRQPPRMPRAVLSAAEMEEVLRQADPDTPEGLRDRALLELMYATGIRRMEVIGLGVFDVDFEQGLLRVRHGKGQRQRVIPVGERACAWMERYLAEVRPSLVIEPGDGALFLADGGKAFHPQYLSRKVRGYIEASGVRKPGGCHLIRHTVATLMLDGGADIRFVQHMLGHAEISTTQIYTQVAVRKLQEVYRRSHPAARLERRATAPAAGEEDGAAEMLAALAEEQDDEGELEGEEGEGG
jgi:integrase/recombinase XerD